MRRRVTAVVLAACLGVLLLSGCALLAGGSQKAAWKPSGSGKPAFYYFGTPG